VDSGTRVQVPVTSPFQENARDAQDDRKQAILGL
jgi:hypothetical protein